MGILNFTPDSFSDGGRFRDSFDAIEEGVRMIDEGADIVDVGGESTRPGASAVGVEEELRRVMPVVEGLVKRGVVVSIDTRKPDVALRAISAGAKIVNDVSGFGDPRMAEACSETDVSVCLMHMRGDPESMQVSPSYVDVVFEVKESLLAKVELALTAGISRERIWIDPGIGFGKTDAHNLRLLQALPEFVETGFSVLIGVSRKGFIGRILGGVEEPLPVTDRLEGTLAAQVFAQIQGSKIIRAHDVVAARRAIDMTTAIMMATSTS